MNPKRALASLQRVKPGQLIGKILYGKSSIFGAMCWMFGLSLVLTLLLAWVPVIGPFIGPVLGGYIGGYRAGSTIRGMLAATLPAFLLSILIVGVGIVSAAVSDLPILGALSAVVAGALAIVIIIHNILLFCTAFVGGMVRGFEST